ncbi:SDR family NAD(P)-dependent oxidoreductase [Candidatus Woesearchaeota archaeon]|nr:SDR family NAD(P)-dependent oxidoreductase [Candidatus Woesearchaeota archaeon]
MQIENKVVVITGASRGIGKSLAREFSRNGAITVITARSIGKLKEVESELKHNSAIVHPIAFDVTSKKSIESMINEVIRKYGRIDVLVNNAALAFYEEIADSKWDDIDKLFKTNFFGPLQCIQTALPYMKKRRKGLIVNISAPISRYSLHHQGVYSASKAALERITEALDIEEGKYGIETLIAIIDRTKTDIKKYALGPKKYARLPYNLQEADPDAVAKKIVRAVIRGDRVCFMSKRSWVFGILSVVCPQFINKMFKKSHSKFISSLK